MKSFEVPEESPEKFARKVERALQTTMLGKITRLKVDEEFFKIRFIQAGRSELVFSLDRRESGFSVQLQKESIAFTHSLLRGEIENTLQNILIRLGAQKIA